MTAEKPSRITELGGEAGVGGISGCRGFARKKTSTSFWMVLFVGWALVISAPESWGGDRVVLLHERDAARLRLTRQEWRNVPRSRNLSIGPIIVVQQPKVIDAANVPTIEAATPIDFLVLFQPRDAAVDLDSLDVEARKGFFSRSLTALLRPYIHGTVLQVRKAEIPAGRFLLQISIADQAGNTTTQTYRLEIVQP